MPGFDGSGPQGKGPMTGRGMGFCVLQESQDKSGHLRGFAGIEGIPINNMGNIFTKNKIVIDTPRGLATTGGTPGFYAGCSLPVFMSPVLRRFGFYGRIIPAVGSYRAASYGYGIPYGRSFGFGRGFGRGRGRFGFLR